MVNFLNLLSNAKVVFPSEGAGWFPWIGTNVYHIINWFHSAGIQYGVAVILFTIILKLILLPIDFLTKYLTKKNARKMAIMKPDLDMVREQYANEPTKLMFAQQQIYKHHGYKMGGFALFMLFNVFITMAVFFSVFASLNAVSDHNSKLTAEKLHEVYVAHEAADTLSTQQFKDDINAVYNNHKVSFLWVGNVWKPDYPMSRSYMNDGEYITFVYGNPDGNPEWFTNPDAPENQNARAEYAHIFGGEDTVGAIDKKELRWWNGLFILIALAGVTAWLSAHISGKVMTKTKTKEEENKKEEITSYSMRDVRDKANAPAKPAVDPQMMQKIMKFMLPIMLVMFTFMSTAALAIYIITNSVMSTITTSALNWPCDKLLDWQEKRAKASGATPDEIDTSIINPHAKYFKKRK